MGCIIFMLAQKLKIYLVVLLVVALSVGGIFYYRSKNDSVSSKNLHDNSGKYANDSDLVGPGGNVSDGAPEKKELKLFAISVPGVLSRSGQPTIDGFKWLKDNGWKSVVDFREDGEKDNSYSVDSKLPGFNELGFNFLSIPIKDGTIPSIEQADQFLKFATDPKNQPVHVHCAAGIGRTGIAVALYRYSVQGWPMEKAIEEADLFTKSINASQKNWLMKWAGNHEAGKYPR